MSFDRGRFGIWDYGMFAGIVVASAIVGLYHAFNFNKKKTTAQDFLMGGRNIGLGPLILSTIATAFSAVGLMGLPTEVYQSGIQFSLMVIGTTASSVCITYLYMPILHELGVTSMFEYLELRYNKKIRMFTSAFYILLQCLYTGCVMYVPALAITQVTGLNTWFSVLSVSCVCMVYTSLGGLRAVIWTDVVQAFVMYIAMIIIITKGFMNNGGILKVWERADIGKRTTWAYWYPDQESRYTVWSLVFGWFFYLNYFYGCNQMFAQRHLASPTVTRARWNMLGFTIGSIVMYALCLLLGLLIYASYHNCDPLLAESITSRDQLLPLYAVSILSFLEGLPGVFVAGMVSAALSSLSSVLNSLATITLEDFIRPMNPKINEKTALLLSKLLGIAYGIICIGAAALVQMLGTVVELLFLINGTGGGAIAGLFTAGMLLPWVNNWGAIAGLITSIAYALTYVIGTVISKPYHPLSPVSVDGCMRNFTVIATRTNHDVFPLFAIHPIWSTCITTILFCVVALLVSAVTKPTRPIDLPEGVVCPIVPFICYRLPKRIRMKLGYSRGKLDFMKVTTFRTQPKNETTASPEVAEQEIPMLELNRQMRV